MKKTKKLNIIYLFALVIVGLGIIGIVQAQRQNLSVEDEVKQAAAEILVQNILDGQGFETLSFGGQADEPRDVFGLQVGTSTTATAEGSFYTARHNNATTSKALLLNGMTDTATYTIRPITASSSSWFDWKIFGSNDTDCDTSTTTTVYENTVITDQINWYDADPTNSRTAGTITNMTDSATGTVVLLTDLNWRCLRFDAMGASTTIGVQLREKSFR